MEATLSLSIDRIIEVVLAHAAAVDIWNGIEDRPTVLNSNHKPMLCVFAETEINRLAMELSGVVVRLESPDDDIRLLTVDIPAATAPRIWQRNFETLVCNGVLARAWDGHPDRIADMYTRDREALLASFRSSLATSTVPGRIARGA